MVAQPQGESISGTAHQLDVERVQIASRDMWWMLGFCLVAVIPVIHRGRRISRFEGMLAVGAYVVYIATLLFGYWLAC